MPYKRRRKRYRKKRTNGYGSMLSSAYKMGKLALSMLNTEQKVIDRIDASNITDTGALYHLNPVSQGTTSETRVGQSLRMKNIFMRYRLTYNTSGDETQAVRVIVFVDKQPNGASLAVSDLLETAVYDSPLDHLQGKRFLVLCDEMYNLYQRHNGVFEKCFIDLEQNEKYKEVSHVEYIGNVGTIADVNTNAVYILFIGSQSTANYPSYRVNSRIKFIDN